MFALERFHRGLHAGTKILGLVWMLCAARPAHAQHLVDFGDTITEPGVYFLNGNQSGTGSGIFIDSDDVALFMFRFTLRFVPPPPPLSSPVAPPIGIVVLGRDNVTIIGGRVTNFAQGLLIDDCNYCTVKDTRFDHNGLGIGARQLFSGAFVRVRTDHNEGNGISGVDWHSTRCFSVRSDANGGSGITLRGDTVPCVGDCAVGHTDNSFKKCWLAYNERHGLELIDADFNRIEENQCVANDGSGILLTADFPTAAAGPGAGDGSDGNHVLRNWCPANGFGIAVAQECTDNELRENIALASFEVDAFDGNPPPCVNTWFLDTLILRGGAGAVCIF